METVGDPCDELPPALRIFPEMVTICVQRQVPAVGVHGNNGEPLTGRFIEDCFHTLVELLGGDRKQSHESPREVAPPRPVGIGAASLQAH